MASNLKAENVKLLFTIAIYDAAFKRVATKLESGDANDGDLMTAKHMLELAGNYPEDAALGEKLVLAQDQKGFESLMPVCFQGRRSSCAPSLLLRRWSLG